MGPVKKNHPVFCSLLFILVWYIFWFEVASIKGLMLCFDFFCKIIAVNFNICMLGITMHFKRLFCSTYVITFITWESAYVTVVILECTFAASQSQPFYSCGCKYPLMQGTWLHATCEYAWTSVITRFILSCAYNIMYIDLCLFSYWNRTKNI